MIDLKALLKPDQGQPATALHLVDKKSVETCMLAFPQMAGVYARDEVAATAKDPLRWQELAMVDRGFFQPTGDTAMICYEARAVRGSGEPYRALVGTLYVLGEDGWKMAFHSQAPLADGSG